MSSFNKLLKIANKFENKIKKLSQTSTSIDNIDTNDQENVSDFLFMIPKNKNKLQQSDPVLFKKLPLKIDGRLGNDTREAIQKSKEFLGSPYMHDEELFQVLRTSLDLSGIKRIYYGESGEEVKY